MKSSLSSASHPSKMLHPVAWVPNELETPETPDVDALAAELIAELFKSPSEGAPQPASLPTRLFKVSRGSIATNTWQPGEIEALPFMPAPEPQWQAPEPPEPEAKPVAPDPEPAADLLALAQEQVNQILAQAHAQAEQILQDAQQQAEAIRQEAHTQGIHQANAEMASLTQTAQEIITQASTYRADLLARSETEVVDLVREMAQTLFGEGVQLDPKTLEDTFARILVKARSLGDLRVFVNPQDALKLDPAWQEFQVSISGQRIQIVPSEGVQPGGCLIEGQQGTVDARTETRLQAVMNIFEEDPPAEGSPA